MKQVNAVPDRAATFVVSPTPGIGDATTIADAIEMLGAGGGYLFLREGTYSISSTVTLPDKPVVIVGCGQGSTVIDIGSNAIAAFTIPNGLATYRQYRFENLSIAGDKTAGQEGIRISDANSYGQAFFESVTFRDVETPVNVTAGDVGFNRSTQISFTNVFAQPPTGLTTAKLLKSASTGGAFNFGTVFTAVGLQGVQDFAVFAATDGWSIDADADVILENSSLQTPSTKSSSIAGLFTVTSAILGGNVVRADRHATTLWGAIAASSGSCLISSFIASQNITDEFRLRVISTDLIEADLIFNNERGCMDSCITTLDSKIFLNGERGRLVNCVFQATSDVAVTIAPAATYAKISNCHFRQQSVTGISTGSTLGAFSNNTFEQGGGVSAIVETGAADANRIDNSTGLTSAGLTIIGPSSVVDGAQKADASAASTNALVTIANVTNPKGVLGIGTIRNTGGVNSIDVKETFTDAFGTTSSVTTTVLPGNSYMLDPQTNIGTGFPPYLNYKVEVIDTVAGNHSTYVSHLTSQGAI